MKAIICPTYGFPDKLRLEDIPEPIPAEKEVKVKVKAASLNSWDWDMMTGRPFEYRLIGGLFKPKSVKLHGCEIAGIIESVGAKVTHFNIGDKVFGDIAEYGWGSYAEYVCAREDDLCHKPPDMTFAEAACLSHGGNLATQGLIDFGNVATGQSVLINGGCGSTGTLAIQLGKVFGAEVTAVDNSEKFDTMQALGADHLIDYTKEDFTRNGRKYDLIFDVKTDRSFYDYRRVLSPLGTYVTVGGKTGRLLQLALLKNLYRKKKVHIVGYKANKDLKFLITLYQEGMVRPVIDRDYPLEKTADAFRYYARGDFKGKIVITLDS